jgi:hypothetical protein
MKKTYDFTKGERGKFYHPDAEFTYSQKIIVDRIDAIINELHWLRQQVLHVNDETVVSANIVDELAGSLGQGNWDEYDKQLDWERFAE